jgi:hypothetical protein
MRFETFYLFLIQLVFFLSLSVALWVWALLMLEALNVGGRRQSPIFWGVALRALAHSLGTSLAFALWASAPLLRALLHTPLEYWAHA